MPRPSLGDRPMTAAERARKRRQSVAAELQALRAENERLRKQLAHAQELYERGFEHGSMNRN